MFKLANLVERIEHAANCGYWRPVKPEFASVVREKLNGYKDAGLTDETEQGFEASFASLAYTYVTNQAPKIIKNLIGFQLLDRNKDNTKAVGLFAAQIGDLLCYVPIFFVSNDMKGHELLWIKNHKQFRPLKDNWLNYLMSEQRNLLGEPIARNKVNQLGRMPSMFGGYSYPLKFGSSGWFDPAAPLLASAFSKSAAFLYGPSAAGRQLDVDSFLANPKAAAAAGIDLGLEKHLCSDFGDLVAVHKMAEEYPAIREGISKFYGEDFFQKAGGAIKSAFTVPEHELDIPWSGRLDSNADFKPRPSDYEPFAVASVPGLRFNLIPGYIEGSPGEMMSVLEKHLPGRWKGAGLSVRSGDAFEKSAADAEVLLARGYSITDTRKPEEVSEAYFLPKSADEKMPVQDHCRLGSPTETGAYDLLTSKGEFERVFVFMSLVGIRNVDDRGACVVVKTTKSDGGYPFFRADASTLSVKPEFKPDLDFVEKLSKGSIGDTYETYLVYDGRNGTYGPFTVTDKVDGDCYRVRLRGKSWDGDHERNLDISTEKAVDRVGSVSPRALLVLDDENPRRLLGENGEVHPSPDCKILKLKADDFCSPGAIESLHMNRIEKVAKLATEIRFRGHDKFDVKRAGETVLHLASRPAAVAYLVFGRGLDEAAAESILGESEKLAHRREPVRVHIKEADFLDQNVTGPSIPEGIMSSFQTPTSSGDMHPARQQFYQPVDSVKGSPEDYNTHMTADDVYGAQQASDKGDKQVFEANVFKGLLRQNRGTKVFDEFIPIWLEALDKFCTALFLCYWHGDAVRDRYGQQDLPEVEDWLRNAVDSIGDLVLFVQQKTVQPIARLDFKATGGDEPSLTESPVSKA